MQSLTTNPGLLSPFHVAFPVHDPFFLDPSGNALEIKAFSDIAKLFAK